MGRVWRWSAILLVSHLVAAIYESSGSQKVKVRLELKDPVEPPPHHPGPVTVYARGRSPHRDAPDLDNKPWSRSSHLSFDNVEPFPAGTTDQGQGGFGRSREPPPGRGQGSRGPPASGHHGPPTCPGPNGLFPHPTDCSKYLNCAGGRAFEQKCGPGTLFNPAISTCDWPAAVTCLATPSAEHEEESMLSSLFGSAKEKARSAMGSVVDIVNTVVDGEVTNLMEKVDWSYERTKDKGRRLLKKFGIKDSKTLCLKPDGVFPYPKDCSKFVNCWRGRPNLQSCGPGTLFNAAKGVCDHPHATVCPKGRALHGEGAVTPVVPPVSGQQLRLRGSAVPWAGYVQVMAEGRWWLVTDSEWTIADASVVCRSLGFVRGAETATSGRTFGLVPGLRARLREVHCQGHEDTLEECRYQAGSQDDVEKTIVGVRCRRNWVSECRGGGVRWGHKCYHVHTTDLVTHSQARRHCQDQGARLLSIASQDENDFISEVLSAGDSPGYHTGGVRQQVFDQVFWLWQNDHAQPQPSLNYTAWWPGWNVSAGVGGAGPVVDAEGTGTLCIVLRDAFPVTAATHPTAPADYFFWQIVDCGINLHFVCESDKLDIGCLEGRGESYSGAANVTESGLGCVPWSHPAVRHKMHAHPAHHNHCRNPDGDDLPFCFTDKGTVEFCDIPRCEQRGDTEEVEEDVCGADKFSCASGQCIHQEWQCDGQADCSGGEDEQGCRDYTQEFTKFSGQRLEGQEVEKWLYTVLSACASRCAQAKSFVCMSFNYQASTETCILNRGIAGSHGGRVVEAGWEYYELTALAPDCSSMYTCTDGKCLNNTQECDGRRDCSSGEDEATCGDRFSFDVRLVNGSGPHDGRVEVKVLGRWGPVCDDMWGMPEGDVVCRQLGFELGARDVFVDSRFGSGGGQYLMDDLNCAGTEDSLADCDFAGWGEHDCQPEEAAGVECYRAEDGCGQEWQCGAGRCVELAYVCDRVPDCADGSDEDPDMCQAGVQARLVDSGRDSGRDGGEGARGRLEVRHLGVWGTVCDDDFGLEEAHVACRMLGWSSASGVYKNNSFGPGSGRVWLDDVKCLGYEASLADCQHPPWGHHNCDHSEDVGVSCVDAPVEPEVDTTEEEVVPLPESLPPSCGHREVDDIPNAALGSAKVVSGRTPPPGAYPWMVAILVRTKAGAQQWCGGAVLSPDHVLTAAHCLYKYPPSTYIVRLGDFDVNAEEEGQQEFRVASMALHPRFDKGPYLNNDVAIIRIKRKLGQGIRFGATVQPVCLAQRGFTYQPYLNCSVAGWGSLGPQQGFSKVLQSATLPILPGDVCRADHVYGATRLTEGMYCAGYLEGGVDTCQGDSGGPMVCVVEGRHTAVGITSWGHGCARANKPGVYTRLTHYLPWIYDNLR